MCIKLEEKEHIEILLVFTECCSDSKFQMFRELEGIENFKMSRDIVLKE